MNIYSPILLLLKVCADAVRRGIGQRQRTVFEQGRKDEIFWGTVDFFDKGYLFVLVPISIGLWIFILVLLGDYLSLDALTSALTSFDASPSGQIAVVVQVVWWVALIGSVVWFLLLRAPRFRKRYDGVKTIIDQKTRYYEISDKISDFLFIKNRSFGYPIILLFCITTAGGLIWIILPYVSNWSDTSITYQQEARPHDWKEAAATWLSLFATCWTAIIVVSRIIKVNGEYKRISLFLVTSLLIALFTAIACRAAIEIFYPTPMSTMLISFVGGYDVILCRIALEKIGRSWDSTAAKPTVQLGNNGAIATIIGLTLGIMALKFWAAWEFWLDDAIRELRWVEALVGENAHIILIFPGTLAGLGASGIGMIQGNTSIWAHTGLAINPAVLAGVIIYTGFYWIGS